MRRLQKYFPKVVQNFIRHDGFYLASHISFCAILSVIPLILIGVSIVGFALGSSQDVYHQLVRAIADLLPQGKVFLTETLKEIVGQRQSFGVLGGVFLLFIATLLFGALERALDAIFESSRSRNFFHSRLLAVLLIGIISLFFFLPTAADLLNKGLSRYGFNFPLENFIRGPIFYFFFTFVAFVLTVVIIPSHRVRLRYACAGGLVFSAGVLVAKRIFRWYIAKSFYEYNLIYGSLTALVLLLLWIFYVSNILLFSAEIAARLQARHHPKKEAGGNPP